MGDQITEEPLGPLGPEEKADLVIRLRWCATNIQSDSPVVASMQRIVLEAADEIEALRCSMRDATAAIDEARGCLNPMKWEVEP